MSAVGRNLMQFKELSRNIKKIRTEKNLTQIELAEILRVAPQTVSKWERGVSYPDIFHLQKICNVLDVSILDFFKNDEVEGEEDYYIAIDGGGTKTEFVLFNVSGEIVSSVVYGTTNPNSCGIKNTLSTLQEGIDFILTMKRHPKRIFAGIAGSMVGNYRETIRTFLKKRYPFCKVNVVSDVKSIIGSVRENKKCIAAIMGTGSVVFGWDGTDLKRIGGWGYLFGDEGSGYDIGREVLIAAFSYGDGLMPSSEVARLAEEKLGGSASDCTAKIYSEGRSYIASFSQCAFEALEKGDKLAEEIISRSADRFAKLINHMYRIGEYGNRVIISGGLAMHNETMIRMLKDKLDKDIALEIPSHPPVFGAMRTCLEMDGVNIDYDAFETKFVESYKSK